MLKIELIYDHDCPNVEVAKSHLKQALTNLSKEHTWQEWDRGNPRSPSYVQQYGSPTILINGKPIGKLRDDKESRSCSIYRDTQENILRAPSVEQIQSSILEANKQQSVMGMLSAGIASILAFIPFISCPLCWPAYASFLAYLGIGIFNFTPYFIPILFGLVILSCVLIWRDHGSHKRFSPFILALTGGVLILIGKVMFSLNYLLYVGIICLLTSTILNFYFVRKTSRNLTQFCVSCCNKKEEKDE